MLYERLLIDNVLLFDYDYKNERGNLDGVKTLAPTLNWAFVDEDCILKYIINNTVLDDSHPLRQMMRFVSNMLWFRSLDENRYIGYKTKSNDYYDFIFERDTLKEFEAFLHQSGIKDALVVIKDVDGKRRLYFNADSPLPFFNVASSGTRAL